MALPIESISSASLLPMATPGAAQPGAEQVQVPAPASAAPAVQSAQPNAPPSAPQVSEQELSDAVAAINRRLQENGQSLQFSIDRDTEQVVVRVIDTTTNEVIRQIPPPVALAISQSVSKFQGLFHQKV